MKIFNTVFVLLFFVVVSIADFPPETPWSGAQIITNLANPNYLQTVRDTAYNINITRISDETVFGKSGGAIQHQYSKVQAWNCDMSLISLGFTTILDAGDYSLIGTLEIGMSLVDGRLIYSIDNVKQFDWNVGNMTSGIYIVKAQAGNKIITKKITLIR